MTGPIHEIVAEKVQLAGIYAEDGAFRTAAIKLDEAANMLRAHADWCDGIIDDLAKATGAQS